MKKNHPTFADLFFFFKVLKPKWLQTVTEWKGNLCCRLCCCWALLALWNTSHSDSFSLQSLAVGENRLSHLDAALILCGDGSSLQAALKQTSAYERESGPRERELQYKLTMAAAVFSLFFLFIAPSRCQPQQPLCPLWHPMAALLHHMKERRRGGVGSCRLGLGTWIQSWGAVSSSGVKVFSGEFLMCPTSWLFPDFSSASVEMSSAQFFYLWLRRLTLNGHTRTTSIIPFRAAEAHPRGKS